jgi:hypothetical protein
MANLTDEQRRLKKERKVLRVSMTISLDDEQDFKECKDRMMESMLKFFGPYIEDISIFPGWKERK